MRTPPLALLLALAITGCGLGSDDPVDIASTWYEAVVDGDAARACEVMEPSATFSLRDKYTDSPEGASCEAVVREYVDMLDRSKAAAVADEGFEAGEPGPTGDVGVFPAAPKYENDILLTRKVDDEWRLVSVGVPPR